jgi:fluoroquinolone transport system permease protein
MNTINNFKTDLKQITRDEVTGILLFAPLLMVVVFKLLLYFMVPFLQSKTGFDLAPYYGYVISVLLILSSGVLGIVTGFLMIDDRDGGITELMAVTPLGLGGYMFNRLLLIALFSFVYTFIIYSFFAEMLPGFFFVILLALLQAIYASIVGLLLYMGADDKVKGLTYAKALNIMMLFALSDLTDMKWLHVVSGFFPTYWFSKMIRSLDSTDMVIGLFVHLVWMFLLVFRFLRNPNK